MTALTRNPAGAARGDYDLIVVGGGIHGACAVLEAARRGLRPLLLESGDYGGATSANSLRIVHGGLRYLQDLDLARFRESVLERRWFLRHFPDLVRPLACLMPLYGEGLRRPGVFRAALALNAALSPGRNRGIPPHSRLPAGGVVDAAEVRRAAPTLDTRGLRAGGVWHDAHVLSPARLLIDILRRASTLGAAALNSVRADSLIVDGGRVRGVRGTDLVAGDTHEFRAPRVVNAAGPWCAEVAAAFGAPGVCPPLTLAFNLLLDIDPPCAGGLAVTPRRRGARSYFLVPRHGRTAAGTFYIPWTMPAAAAEPPESAVHDFLAELNACLPAVHLRRDHVICMDAGVLPARAPGDHEPAGRPVLVDHGRTGGPPGLVSVAGVKYTTARRTAERALRAAFPGLPARRHDMPAPAPTPIRLADLLDPSWPARAGPADAPAVAALARAEAVVHTEDLLRRRTEWGHDPRCAPEFTERLAHLLAAGSSPASAAPAAV